MTANIHRNLHQSGIQVVIILLVISPSLTFDPSSHTLELGQDTPLCEKQTESLTTYQMNFLRAILDGDESVAKKGS